MDFWDVICARRSVRAFAKQDVSDTDIKKLLQAAHIAPSGSNQKNWHFIVVKSGEVKSKMKQAVIDRVEGLIGKMNSAKAKSEFRGYSQYFTFFTDASCVIAVVMKPYDSTSGRILKMYEKNTTYSSTAGLQGVAAAIENMLLAAAALGLGGCWMTGPLIAKEALERILKVEPPNELLAIVPIGYPKDTPKPHKLPEDLSGAMTTM